MNLTDTEQKAYVSQLVFLEMVYGMLIPHFPGRLEAILGLMPCAAAFKHLHAC